MKNLFIILSALMFAAFSTAALAEKECNSEKKCCETRKTQTSGKTAKDPTAQEVVIDPVCGMDVKVSESKHSCEYKGKTYHFCSESCKKSFSKDPSKYIGESTRK